MLELFIDPISVNVSYDDDNSPQEQKADVPQPTNNTTAPSAPSEKQLAFLKNLGYKGVPTKDHVRV